MWTDEFIKKLINVSLVILAIVIIFSVVSNY